MFDDDISGVGMIGSRQAVSDGAINDCGGGNTYGARHRVRRMQLMGCQVP